MSDEAEKLVASILPFVKRPTLRGAAFEPRLDLPAHAFRALLTWHRHDVQAYTDLLNLVVEYEPLAPSILLSIERLVVERRKADDAIRVLTELIDCHDLVYGRP
jgi:hypothetical protein